MRFEFIQAEEDNFPVRVMCRVLEVSTAGFYAWCKRAPSAHQIRDRVLDVQIQTAYETSRGCYGSPRIAEQLRRNGHAVSENKVAKSMKKLGIAGRKKRRFKATTDSKHTKRIAPNLLERNFRAEAPNQVWVTDVTAVWTQPGWVFLAAIIDLFSRRVVGWAMSEDNDTQLALAALNKAIRLRNPQPGLFHHSDRGSPYGSDKYIARLKEADIIPSMSRKGDC